MRPVGHSHIPALDNRSPHQTTAMAYPFIPLHSPHNQGFELGSLVRVSSPSSSSSYSDDSALDLSTEEIRPHCCPFPDCGRRFKRRYTLKDHIKSHTGERPFVCPVRSCHKGFSTSGNLARHKRLHPWLDTPLPCLVDGCGCAFPNEEKLQRHMMTHFGDSSTHRCEYGNCGKVFATVGNLRRHIKHTHSKERILEAPSNASRAAHCPPPTSTECTLQSSHAPVRDLPPNQPAIPRGLPSDGELLEALSCLFDDESTPPCCGIQP